MATDVLELATTLKYLGAKWLPGKKLILRPAHKEHNMAPNYKGLHGIFYKISMKVVKS